MMEVECERCGMTGDAVNVRKWFAKHGELYCLDPRLEDEALRVRRWGADA